MNGCVTVYVCPYIAQALKIHANTTSHKYLVFIILVSDKNVNIMTMDALHTVPFNNEKKKHQIFPELFLGGSFLSLLQSHCCSCYSFCLCLCIGLCNHISDENAWNVKWLTKNGNRMIHFYRVLEKTKLHLICIQ